MNPLVAYGLLFVGIFAVSTLFGYLLSRSIARRNWSAHLHDEPSFRSIYVDRDVGWAALRDEVEANQRRIIQLTEAQGPAVMAAIVAAVNGSIGGRIGLGFQKPDDLDGYKGLRGL